MFVSNPVRDKVTCDNMDGQDTVAPETEIHFAFYLMHSIVYFVFVLFVVIKQEKPYFASRPGIYFFFLCITVSTRSPNQNPKNLRERSAPG